MRKSNFQKTAGMEGNNRLEQKFWHGNKFHQGPVCRPAPSTVHKYTLNHKNNWIQTAEQRKLDAVCQQKKRKKNSEEEKLDDRACMGSYSVILVSFTTIWDMELWSKGTFYHSIYFIPWPPYPLIRVSLYPLTSLSPISRSHIDIYCSYHPVALSRSVATWILDSKTETAVIGIWSKASSHEHANGCDTRSWPSVPRQYRGPVDRCELEASISLDHVCWNSKALRNDWLWFFESSWIVPRCSAIHACLSRFDSKTTFALFWCVLSFLEKQLSSKIWTSMYLVS